MKSLLITILTLLSLSTLALNEGLSNADLVKLSADKDIQLLALKDYFKQERDNAEGISDHTEGKIVAAIIDSTEREIKAVEKILFSSNGMTEDDLRRIDFNDLQTRLDNIREMIDQINL
jgi:hypothetical protein